MVLGLRFGECKKTWGHVRGNFAALLCVVQQGWALQHAHSCQGPHAPSYCACAADTQPASWHMFVVLAVW